MRRCSGVFLAACCGQSLASEFKVPIVSGGAADALGFPPDPYLFKVAPGVRDFMTVLAQYAQRKGYKRVALLNMTDAFGQNEAKFFKELAPQHGIEVVAAETMAVEDTNFNAQLTRIRAAQPGHDLQWRREPRRDPELEADQAARH